MFETLIRTSQVRPAWKSTVVISLVGHAVAVTLLILLPMVYFQVVDTRFLTGVIAGTRIEPVPPSPPPSRPAAAPVQPRSAQVRELRLPPMTAPPTIPVGLPDPNISNLPPVGDDVGYLGPSTSPFVPGITGPMVSSASPVPRTPLPPPPPKPRRHEPVLVSTISPGGLIYRVEPEYPTLARQARAQGPVKLELLINEEGTVREVVFVSGNVLLKDAAIAAVKQWRYRPTILNGEPVPIQGTVTVNFILSR